VTLADKAQRVDRGTRQNILDAAKYQCQLSYRGCTITAIEVADVGGTLKAACRECRLRRDGNRSHSNRLAGNALRRNRT
jgi:hypothetical protein